MKRIISIFLILVILSTIFAICASAFSSGGYEYEIISGTTNARITSWSGSSGSVSILSTVSNSGTSYKVTEIGDYAFADKPNISRVTFNGSNLTTIGEGAFSTNRSCTSLTIPANVTTIKARAFHSWVSLSTLTFNNGSKLSTIGNWAFRNAQSLSKLKLPDKESGSLTIGDGAFSYCNSIVSVVLPKCVTEIGEEAFIGCINLATVTIRNQNAVIGDNAFDLTANSEKVRTLEIKGQATSTAKTFANAEGFNFTALPAESGDDTITIPPDAGSYSVRVSYTLSNSGFGIGSISLNNTFGSRTSIITDETTAEDECNKAAGIAVQYKTDNGTGTTQTKCWGPTSFTTSTVTATISGFPTLLYSYSNYDGSTRTVKMNVTKLEVKGAGQSNYTTLWQGSLFASSTNKPYAATVSSNGTLNAAVINSHKDTKAESSSGYENGWTANMPTPTTMNALTDGVTEASVNTDGTTYRSPAFTISEITDQYGELMHQNPTLSVTDTSNRAVTGASVDNTYRKLILTPAANRASDYNVRVKQTAGNISNYKTVRIKTFDYNVTFSYTEGTKRETVTQTVDYNQSPTNPGVTPVKYNSYAHQTFNSWSDEYNITYTDGPQDVTIEAQYNDIEAHESYYSDAVSEEATCTEPEQIIQTCSKCGYDKVETGDTPALGHTGDTTPHTMVPIDGKPGVVYYHCTRCNTCWGAVYNNGVFSKDTENEQESIEGEPNLSSVIENTSSANVLAPAPVFNLFTDPSLNNYDYSMRGGSLKISGSSDVSLANSANDASLLTSTTQGMRFTASMHIPEGVALGNTGSGNRLTDFGYVWSQTALIGLNGEDNTNISHLKKDETNVYQTSIVANNSKNGVFTGDNWTGVSAHDDNLSEGGKTLTFNLVVNVKAKNWKKAYCARAYIKYIYNGVEYTVYDQSYSSRSVEYIATAVVGSPYESQKVKNFLQTKVYNNLQYVPE